MLFHHLAGETTLIPDLNNPLAQNSDRIRYRLRGGTAHCRECRLCRSSTKPGYPGISHNGEQPHSDRTTNLAHLSQGEVPTGNHQRVGTLRYHRIVVECDAAGAAKAVL
jgi:hypothetical protein